MGGEHNVRALILRIGSGGVYLGPHCRSQIPKLGKQVKNAGGPVVGIERCRPNIHVGGCGPFQEDEMRSLSLPGVLRDANKEDWMRCDKDPARTPFWMLDGPKCSTAQRVL